MLWWYWAEARPYGLWVFLTGCQMLLLIHMAEASFIKRKFWILLCLVHIALPLTSILSIIQTTIVSTVLFIRNRSWVKFTALFLIPILIAFYYKPAGNSSDVIFVLTIDQMLRDCIARDRLYILLYYPVLLLLYFIQKRSSKIKLFTGNLIVQSYPFFLAAFSMIVAAVLFLMYLQRNATHVGQYIVSRHIIFLLPVGIISVIYLTGVTWETLRKPHWIRILMIISILALLLYRLKRILVLIKSVWHII